MKKLLLLILASAAVISALSGCGRSIAAKKGGKHFLNLYPDKTEELIQGLEREAEHIASEIDGPLRDEIARYMVYHVTRIGPLVYATRDFAEHQLQKARELPDAVAKHLHSHLVVRTEMLKNEIERFGNVHAKDKLPQLRQEFHSYIIHHKKKVDEFISAVRRYDAVNREHLEDLVLSTGNFFKWQVKNAQEVPDATRRYMDKVSRDYDEVMNSTARMFDFNLGTKPEFMAESLMRFSYHNTQELMNELGASTGRYFWNNIQVSDLVKEMHFYADRNLKETEELVDGVQRFFAVNGERTQMLSKEVHKFFEWRFQQWAELKTGLDRYISVNVENFQTFKEGPLRYIQRQQEEFEKLKEIVPGYFLYNISKSEGLGLALRRYIDSQTEY